MAVDHGESSAAAAAAADEVVAEEAGTDSGANNTKQDRTGDGPAPSESGRVPTKRKPKIDIDNERRRTGWQHCSERCRTLVRLQPAMQLGANSV